MERPNQTSKLLQLPTELRLAILEYVFAEDRAPVTIGLPSLLPWQGKPERYHPPLSEVCSVIRKETIPVFYQDRSVIILLRFREGRAQVSHWIKHIYSSPEVSPKIRSLRIQYFEECHRSTAAKLDMQDLLMLNQDSWLHPLTDRPLRLLRSIEGVLLDERNSSHANKARTLQRVITTMTEPLRMSRLMRQESMANLRLNGYTDFELRFEVMNILSMS